MLVVKRVQVINKVLDVPHPWWLERHACCNNYNRPDAAHTKLIG